MNEELTQTERDILFMEQALVLAHRAEAMGEVPVGALVVDGGGVVVGEGWNRPITDHDPTAHAEIQALRAACATLRNYRIPGTTLYVTLEPCSMCAGAIVHARVARVVFGAPDPRTGAAGSVFELLRSPNLNHRAEVIGGVLAGESSQLLTSFFRARR